MDAEAECVHVPACAPAHTTSRVPWRGRARKLLLALAGQAVGSEANTVRSAPPAVRCRSSPAACALTAAAQAGGGRSGGSHPGAGVPQAKRVCASRRPDLLRIPGALAQNRGPAPRSLAPGKAGHLNCCVVYVAQRCQRAHGLLLRDPTAGVCLVVRSLWWPLVCSRVLLRRTQEWCTHERCQWL